MDRKANHSFGLFFPFFSLFFTLLSKSNVILLNQLQYIGWSKYPTVSSFLLYVLSGTNVAGPTLKVTEYVHELERKACTLSQIDVGPRMPSQHATFLRCYACGVHILFTPKIQIAHMYKSYLWVVIKS